MQENLQLFFANFFLPFFASILSRHVYLTVRVMLARGDGVDTSSILYVYLVCGIFILNSAVIVGSL